MTELAESVDHKDLRIKKDSDFYDLLNRSKFVVGPHSSALVESAIVDIPYLFVYMENFTLGKPYSHINSASNSSELSALIENRDNYWKQTRKLVLDHFGIRNCGDGCNLTKDIDELIEQIFVDIDQ
jgi:hypothetical protein